MSEPSVSAVTNPIGALREMGIELPTSTVTDAALGPVWTVPTPADDVYAAADLWLAVRDAHLRTGWWPVLAGPDTWDQTASALRIDVNPPVARDGADWLNAQAAQTLSDLPVGVADFVEPDLDGFDWADALNASDHAFDRLLLVPARAGWLVPGQLGWFGATNVDVLGDEHATILRRWAGQWNAELVGLELDVLTLRVGRPPTDARAALTAATEAALYCSDAVTQGSQTLWRLAAIMALPLWSFWWDWGVGSNAAGSCAKRADRSGRAHRPGDRTLRHRSGPRPEPTSVTRL